MYTTPLLVAASLHSICAFGQPTLPASNPHTPEWRTALLDLRDHLKDTPPPPVSEREQRECLDWMQAASPETPNLLVGHHVIALATNAFAARAAENDFILNLDMGYEVLAHLWGADPCDRRGRRFILYADPAKPGGHSCNGRELIIHIGRGDWNNADWFERYFHEMTHGFQFEHPARHLMVNGFFEGWAEFMQAAACAHLAPLGAPFTGRAEWYGAHFPEVGRIEYVQTCLPIEEIVAYDPASAVLMELVNATRQGGAPDWQPIRTLLTRPIAEPRWVPHHLWPALFAHECMSAFGEDRARPVLAKYRFPLDRPSLDAAGAWSAGPRPDETPRTPVLTWRHIGPIDNPERKSLEWNPLDAEHLAWVGAWTGETGREFPPACGTEWGEATARADGFLDLGSSEGSQFHYLAATLPADLRGAVTLFISSDDDCAVWLDGELVHFFRGSRGCTPDYPDVAYAQILDRPDAGRLVVLVVNHGGPGAFSLSYARGGLLFEGFTQRWESGDLQERLDVTRYVVSRRHQQPVGRTLIPAYQAFNGGRAGREALLWWEPIRVRNPFTDTVEAEYAYYRGSIRGGYFGNNAGASGHQHVGRAWGRDPGDWLSLNMLLHERAAARGAVGVRYACPNEGASFVVRVRRGDRVVFTSERITLEPTADWQLWKNVRVPLPPLEAGRYHVELVEPSGPIDIDLLTLG